MLMPMPIIIPSGNGEPSTPTEIMWTMIAAGWMLNVLGVIFYDLAFGYLWNLKRNGRLLLVAVSLVPFLTAAAALLHGLYRWIKGED